MPVNNYFGFSVLVDDKKLPEYDLEGNIFVESSTHASTSYKILTEDGNEVMVTPYKILLEVPKGAPPRFYKLLIDGMTISRAFLRGGNQRIFWGTLDNSEMKEFVFTFPVEPSEDNCTQSAQSIEGLGTIVIHAMDAINTGVQEFYYRAKFRSPAGRNEKGKGTACLTTLKEISKKDTIRITNGQYPLLHSGMGHTVKVKDLSPCHKLRTQYMTGQLVSSIRLYYRTRLALELLGVIGPNSNQSYGTEVNRENVPDTMPIPADEKPPEGAVREFEEDQFRTMRQLKYDHDDVFKHDDSHVERNAASSDGHQTVKQEPSEDVKWQDRSIIWEGDDDCLITYVRKPWDISLVELTDSDNDEEYPSDRQPAAVYGNTNCS